MNARVLGSGGYEPASGPAERRAQFDLRRSAVFSSDIRRIVTISAVDYAALSPPDPETLYVVT